MRPNLPGPTPFLIPKRGVWESLNNAGKWMEAECRWINRFNHDAGFGRRYVCIYLSESERLMRLRTLLGRQISESRASGVGPGPPVRDNSLPNRLQGLRAGELKRGIRPFAQAATLVW